MMSGELYTLVFGGIALIAAFFGLFQQMHFRAIDKTKREVRDSFNALNQKLKSIKSISSQQYSNLTEHINENFNIISNILTDFYYEGDSDLLEEQLKAYQGESIVRLRKIEMASFSKGTQKEAIMFFVGNYLGRRQDVIGYTRTLLETNIIHLNNRNLALRILRQNTI